MGFGLLMKDSTPVDFPFRRSGSAAEEAVRLGFVPGGPYYPRGRGPNGALGFVPGGPYYPRGRGPDGRLGYVPGGPYYPANRRFRGYGIPPGQAARVPQYNGMGFGWVDSTGGGDDPDPMPGTASQQESTGWQNIVTGILNLGTSVTGAIAGSINANTGASGAYCPTGYQYANGRCYPMQSSGGMGAMGGVALVAAAGLAAILLLKK